MKPTPANAWMEFDTFQHVNHLPNTKVSFCGLCGNSGFINTIGTAKTPQGKPCGVKAFCICPNGRALKRASYQTKWGGDSVIEHEGFPNK